MKHRKLHQPTEIEEIRAQHLVLQAIREEFRSQLQPWERLRKAQDKARIVSTVPSAGISEYTTSGKTEGSEPPQQQETVLSDHLALVIHAIELYEQAVDAEAGVGSSASVFSMMSKEEKDKELLKWRGVPSFVVAAKAPWLGKTPRTIERIRKELGVRQSDGAPLIAEVSKRAA